MASFIEFLGSLDADAGRRGKQFEHFVKWFLKNDPQWSTQVDEVWLWDDWPLRWGPDCGIDLIFKHKDGQTWAVQSKCYDAKYNITKHDVDKFLSESNRAGIDKRLLIATTDGLGANAKQVCDAQDKEVVRYLLSHFEDADIEYPNSLADLHKAKPKSKPLPKPHQVKAIEAVTKGFIDTDRGQLIMACGTGKTFTTLWIKEALNSESTLILLPSLGLLSQTLHEWTGAKSKDFAVLCVCSDESVGKKGGDEAVHDIADLAFPVTSDPVEIAKFLNQDGPKVVFSTYQSSNLVADAQADQKAPIFNLAIADEAHRCAGDKAGNFATILDAQRIRANKRLFTTATPRTYSTALKKGAEGRGIEIVGMDNEEVFGKQLYTLNFGQAIKDELLTDYRVVIVGVDSPMIASYIENREFVKTETGLEKDAETLAAQVALLKAMKDFDLHRMISFHSKVKRADDFASDLNAVASWVDAKHSPSGELKADFVSGEMPTFVRRQKLAMLKNAKDNERTLLTNARCLSEGVDVPSLDGVAFIDPKGSQVDIIQAVGRAIRLSPNKQAGTIVLPVFIGHGDNPEQALDEGNFKPIWAVLNALKSHDDVLADELDQMRVGMGKRASSKAQGGFSKIKIDLPASVDKSFSDSIQTRLVENTTASWDFYFGLLEEYVEVNGDALVPALYKTQTKLPLGAWVNTQRSTRKLMYSSRVKKLEAIPGWTWDVLDLLWENGYKHALDYVALNGTLPTPNGYVSDDGFNLDTWLRSQRSLKAKLSEDKVKKIEALNGWLWSPHETRWNDMYEQLFQYTSKYNTTVISKDRSAQHNGALARWAITQRKNKNKLSDERRLKLESLPYWSWDPRIDKWDAGFESLVRYVQIHGNCLVPNSHKDDDGFKLGMWVQYQRQEKAELTSDRIKKLEELNGWVWSAKDLQWEKNFSYLRNYSSEYGHTGVPYEYVADDGFQVGKLVNRLRTNRHSLSSDKIKELESLNSWAWDMREEKWQIGFRHLLSYVEEHKTSKVNREFIAEDAYPLGSWVRSQRALKEKMPKNRLEALESLPDWSWSK